MVVSIRPVSVRLFVYFFTKICLCSSIFNQYLSVFVCLFIFYKNLSVFVRMFIFLPKSVCVMSMVHILQSLSNFDVLDIYFFNNRSKLLCMLYFCMNLFMFICSFNSFTESCSCLFVRLILVLKAVHLFV